MDLSRTFQIAEEEVAALSADADLQDLARGLNALFASAEAQTLLANLLSVWGLSDPIPLDQDRRAAFIAEGKRRAARDLYTLTLLGGSLPSTPFEDKDLSYDD